MNSAAGSPWTHRGNVWLVATLRRRPVPRMQGREGKAAEQCQAAAIRPCLLSRHSLGVCSTKVAVASRYLATVQSVISSTSACCNLLQLAFARIQCRARYIRLQCVGSNVMSPAALKEQQSWRPVPVKVCLGTVFFQIASRLRGLVCCLHLRRCKAGDLSCRLVHWIGEICKGVYCCRKCCCRTV